MLVQDRPAELPPTKTKPSRQKATRQATSPDVQLLPSAALPEASAPLITTLEQVSQLWQTTGSDLRTAAKTGDLPGIIAAQNRLNAVPLIAIGVLRARFVALEEQLTDLAEGYNKAEIAAIAASTNLLETARKRGDFSLEGPDKLAQDARALLVQRLRAHLDEILKAGSRCRHMQGELDALLLRASAHAHVTGLESPTQEIGVHLRDLEVHAASWTAKLNEHLQAKGHIAA